jgi:hypothetical protein
MNAWEWVRVCGIFGPIIGLVLVGFALTLRSGVGHLASGSGMKVALANVSRTVLLVAGCLVGLALIQQFVGLKVGMTW